MESESSIDEHSSTSESCKKSQTAKATSGKGGDIISSLPDEILSEILSHITTKHAVATSVLSKRWNKIWTMVPNLDFSAKTLLIASHFMDFVDNVLRLNRVPSMRMIRLFFRENADYRRLKSWIDSIATRDAYEIELILPGIGNLDQNPSIYLMPDSFFTSKNLVQLLLENVVLKIPESVSFPCLKTVSFFSVKLLDDASMKNLLLGCPVIYILQINREESDNVDTLYICSSTLHYLTLYSMQDGNSFGSKIAIDTPNLRRLVLIDGLDYYYDMIHLSNLVRVRVDINIGIHPSESDFDISNDRLFSLLRNISCVGNMHVGSDTMGSLRHALLERMPMFNNLIRLKVKVSSSFWPVLFHLLHRAPNLVTFVLEKISCFSPGFISYRPIQVPQCFLSRLKYVVLRNLEDSDEDMEIIKYFLESAVALEKMSVDTNSLELEKRILILPISLRRCVFEFTNSKSVMPFIYA